MTRTKFTDREFQIIHEKEFLYAKARAISKIHDLMTEVKAELQTTIQESDMDLEFKKQCSTGKISKGENYRGLPYLVLDYPAIFMRNDIFAFRTMFWWGNFFSCALHLQGKQLDLYRPEIIGNINSLEGSGYYICIGDSPWEYHYEDDNYKLFSKHDLKFVETCSFLKLNKRIELHEWKSLPATTAEILGQLLNLIKPTI